MAFRPTRILAVYLQYDATTDYVAISEADRHPQLDYLATIHHGIDTDAFSLAPRGRAATCSSSAGSIPDKGTAEAIDVATAAGMPLVIAGIVQDQALLRRARRDRGSTASTCRLPRRRERRRPVGAARRRPRAAPPDRFRRALRLQRRRGDGVRHTGDRVRPRLDGRADRGRNHRLPRRRRRRRSRRRRAGRRLDRTAIRATAVDRFGVGRMVDEYVAAYEEIVRFGGARSRGRTPSVRH